VTVVIATITMMTMKTISDSDEKFNKGGDDGDDADDDEDDTSGSDDDNDKTTIKITNDLENFLEIVANLVNLQSLEGVARRVHSCPRSAAARDGMTLGVDLITHLCRNSTHAGLNIYSYIYVYT
jgi:hypothetical protein